ncbi:MAG TPA: spermidine/putrescine ABC transporter substrate-binding protein [Tepidisphaeraceae bacterium]|nr:spermidine/putrescine ABC transporter substrate-binding protein [Tepidisphaeraceae bacterium]
MKYWLVLLTAIFTAGCTKAPSTAAAPKQLNIYIWSEYLPQQVLDQFTQRTGIAVTVDTYDSNETLMAKLASGVAGYDLVVPSDYIIQPLIRQNLIAPLDKSRLTNFGNLDPAFLNQHFDPNNQYSMPYLWGTTGLAYNKKIINTPVDSWDILFDPKYSGRILMLDDMRECFVVALKRMGKSVNETDPAILNQAADMLKKQHALVRAYDSENYDRTLESGDVVVAQGWNGQMAKVVSDRPDEFAYVLPREGGTIWMDNVCIPTGAKNPDAAYQFMNFILEPQPAAEIVNGVYYASPNAAARQFIDPKILNDRNIYPTADMLKGWEFLNDIGPTSRLLDQLWTEIKAQ